MISAPTLLGYSSVLFAMFSMVFLVFWLKDSRRARYLWGALCFFMAVCTTALLVDESVLPRPWAGRIAVVCGVLAYGFVWLTVRAFLDRRARLLWVLLPPAAWLLLRVTVIERWGSLPASGFIICVTVAAYNGLSAYELWRSRAEALPARAHLFWTFCGYTVWHILRAVFTAYLPAPLGVAPNEIWATVVYNLAVVTQATLVSAFLIAFSRERLALQHYNLAVKDPLTGIGNRRAWDEWAQAWSTGGHAARQRLVVLLFDIDHFKAINDGFGHEMGDKVIIAAARTAEQVVRRQDKVFRIGGEEFVCLLPDATLDDAVTVAERLREAFRAAARNVAGRDVSASLSTGIAAAGPAEGDLRDVLARADEALYQAKRAGRDRTVVAGMSPDFGRAVEGASMPLVDPATSLRPDLGHPRA